MPGAICLACSEGIPDAEGCVSVLSEKVFGCLAASQIGSAMGAPVEGWDWRRIEEEYGRLERMLPYEHYNNGWSRQPGTTEDGIERQRVLLRAIRRAGGRIGPENVATVWRQEVDPDAARWCMEPFDRYLIGLARAGVPAVRIGGFSPYANLVSLARSCHPLGLINAGDPDAAWRDVHSVGLVLQAPAGNGLEWAGLVAAVIARACLPGCSFADALAAGVRRVDDAIRREVERALDVAEEAEEPLAMRETFGRFYSGSGVPYAASHANEVVSKGLAVASLTAESPREAVIAGVNFGRDTDCLAAVAGGIVGALAGRADLPDEWIEQVDAATAANPHTCLKLSLAEMSDIVMDGLKGERECAQRRAGRLEQLLS